MRFELSVIARDGIPQLIRLEGVDPASVQAEAAKLGYDVLSVARFGRSWVSTSRARARAPASLDIVVFAEQFRDLLGAGLSVIESLRTLRRGSQGQAAVMLESVERKLREGKALSEAMAETEGFPELLIALVRASELTSDLPQTLTRFLEHEKRAVELRHRLLSTAIYPLLLMGVGSGVLLFLLFYVMPRFARVFEGMAGELPWSARAMVAWSQALQENRGWWLLGVVILVFAAVVILASPRYRADIGRRLLGWDPIRHRVKFYFLARWYRTTGMLVQGGIPLAPALGLASGLLPLGLREQGESVELGVRQGMSPAQAHVRANMATPVAEQLLLAGERTGDLGSILTRIAHFHETEVSRSLDTAMRVVEPIVMVLIGLGVGVVVVLMYLPIFELAAAIQ